MLFCGNKIGMRGRLSWNAGTITFQIKGGEGEEYRSTVFKYNCLWLEMLIMKAWPKCSMDILADIAGRYNACQKSLEHLGHFFTIRISNHSYRVQIPPRPRNNVDFDIYCPSIQAESRIVLSSRLFDYKTTLF